MSEAAKRNHNVFLVSLDLSDPAVWSIAQWLHQKRYHVKISAKAEAPSREESRHYVDGGDLEVVQRVEVKQRPEIDFTGPEDWPYPDMIVCAKHSWDNASPKPWAYFIVSKSGKTAAMIKGDSHPTWKIGSFQDGRYENVIQKCYTAPMNQVEFFALEKPEFAWR